MVDGERCTVKDVDPWTIYCVKKTVIKQSLYGHEMKEMLYFYCCKSFNKFIISPSALLVKVNTKKARTIQSSISISFIIQPFALIFIQVCPSVCSMSISFITQSQLFVCHLYVTYTYGSYVKHIKQSNFLLFFLDIKKRRVEIMRAI